MANETTSSTLSELYTEVIQEAIFTFQETSVMKPVVTTYNISGQGKQIAVPVYPAISAAAIAEGTDLSNTAVNPTETTITASEVGVMTTLTDLAGLFSSFSSDIGSAGTELTADLLFKAQATLRALNVPAPYYGVFNPKAVFNLKKTLTNAGYTTSSNAISEIGNEALRNGYVGRIAGIDVFENANIAIDQYDDAVGAVFHPVSLGLAMKADFKIETQRDASLRGTEIVATVTYGSGVVKSDYGVAITTDSAF